MYDNCLFLTLFLFPPIKKRKEEKENEVAKPVLKDLIDFHPKYKAVINKEFINTVKLKL